MVTRLPQLAALCLLALFVGGTPAMAGSTPAATPSPAASCRASASAICRRAAIEGAMAGPASGSRAAILKAWPRLWRVVATEVKELRQLRPLAELRALHVQAIRSRAAQLQLGEEALRRVRAGTAPRAAAEAIKSRQLALVASERRAWTAAGVPDCAASG